jgi:hypothetical protein
MHVMCDDTVVTVIVVSAKVGEQRPADWPHANADGGD